MADHNPRTGPDGRAERVLRQSRELGDDMKDLANEIAEAAREIKSKVDFSNAIREHPFRTVLIAAGAGYVLGGGLFTPLTGHLMRFGTRAMLVPFARKQLMAMAAGARVASGG